MAYDKFHKNPSLNESNNKKYVCADVLFESVFRAVFASLALVLLCVSVWSTYLLTELSMWAGFLDYAISSLNYWGVPVFLMFSILLILGGDKAICVPNVKKRVPHMLVGLLTFSVIYAPWMSLQNAFVCIVVISAVGAVSLVMRESLRIIAESADRSAVEFRVDNGLRFFRWPSCGKELLLFVVYFKDV